MFQWICTGRVSDKCLCFNGFALAGSVTSVSVDLLWQVSDKCFSGFALAGSVTCVSMDLLWQGQ